MRHSVVIVDWLAAACGSLAVAYGSPVAARGLSVVA